MKLWKRSNWSILDYHKETKLKDRSLEDSLSVLKNLGEELYRIHLKGFVVTNWPELLQLKNGNWKHNPEFARPRTRFEKLEKNQIQFSDYCELQAANYFLAPEQIHGHHDSRTDIFNYGLLAALLLSENLFDNEDNWILFRKIQINDEVEFVSEQYAKAIKKCLAFKPENRKGASVIELLSGSYLHNHFYEKLKSFKERLVQFSANNSMLNHHEASLSFILNPRLLLGKDFSEEDSSYDILNKLRLKGQANYRQSGVNTIYLCKGLLQWQHKALDNKQWNSLILKKAVSLEKKRGIKSVIRVLQNEDDWQVNEHLRIVFKHFLGESLPETVNESETSVEEFLNSLQEKYAEFGWRVDANACFIKNLYPGKYAIYHDYEKMAHLPASPNFRELLNAKNLHAKNSVGLNNRIAFSEDYSVLPADESQQVVLNDLQSENNLVVEGPPGTGKSQLIVNAMAHYVAEGKRVLFVSDKKAALDVVYHRLSKSDLESITCRIHDSKSDKKEFVQKIKSSLRRFQKPLERDARLKRKLCLWALEEKDGNLKQYKKDLTADLGEYSMLDIFKTKGQDAVPGKNAVHQETLPTFGRYKQDSEILKSLERELSAIGIKKWKDLPFAAIDANQWVTESQPESKALVLSNRAYDQLIKLNKLVEDLGLPIEYLGDFYQLSSFLKSQKWLIDRGFFSIVLHKKDKDNFEKLRDRYEYQKLLVEKYRSKSALENGPNEHEIQSALDLLQNESKSTELQSFLENYFGDDYFKKDVKNMLLQAKYEWRAEEKKFLVEAKIRVKYQVSNADEFINQTNLLIELAERTQVQIPGIFDWLRNKKKIGFAVADIFSYLEQEDYLQQDLSFLHQRWRDQSIHDLKSYLLKLNNDSPWQYAGSLITLFAKLHPATQFFLLETEIPLSEIETEIVKSETRAFLQTKPQYQNSSCEHLTQLFNERNEAYSDFLKSNSSFIVDEQHRKIQENELLLQSLSSNLTNEQKGQRRSLKKGKRILEHEISKSKQYKTPRQLWHSDSASWLGSIFPISMMSPEVVSEVFPLENAFFDVVIFDEASQVKVEEALPVLYRASQCLVIGDSQQLQPTRFFQSKNIFEESDDEKSLDSLLQLMKMSSIKHSLNKHYRSRDTDLIAFNNAAFYKNELELYPFFSRTSESPIRWLLVENGNFQDGTNPNEAEALVNQFSQLLKKYPEKSFAIVAMSEKQKACIEEKIERLALSDAQFKIQLKNDENKKDDGQFAGLVVRSLEQIQGDERDIVLISVAYSFDNPKNLPNFGPLAHSQGMYRLNVLFSRAKESVRIFTSFHPISLESTDNPSLQILRLYLQYAIACTEDDSSEKSRIMSLLSGKSSKITKAESGDLPITLQQFLQKNGCQTKQLSAGFYSVEKEGHATGNMLYVLTEKSQMNRDYYLAKRVYEKRGFSIFYVDLIELHRNENKVLVNLKRWMS